MDSTLQSSRLGSGAESMVANEWLTIFDRLPRFVSRGIDEFSLACRAEIAGQPDSERVADYSQALVVETSSESRATSWKS